jgi:hypothetical protein
MVSSSQIREQLAQFLDGQISFDKFEDWFLQNTWNIHLSGSVAAEDLTFAVQESLSEYSSGHIDERGLRNELRDLVYRDNSVLVFSDAPTFSWSAITFPAPAFAFARP